MGFRRPGKSDVFTSPGSVALEYRHFQTPDGQPVEVHIEAAFDEANWASDAWVSLASTLKNGTLTLFANGVSVAQASGIVSARIHGSQATGDGLHLVGSNNYSMPGLQVSDLRVSRFARVPNQVISLPDAPKLTIGAAPTGKTINYDLLGGLHTLGDAPTEALTRDSLRVFRTDKLINATPIVAGSPDASHPTPGASGLFSYDWQVVDRTLDYYTRLNATPYISLDSTPQILGGGSPRFRHGFDHASLMGCAVQLPTTHRF